jgi:hypothetical protein
MGIVTLKPFFFCGSKNEKEKIKIVYSTIHALAVMLSVTS